MHERAREYIFLVSLAVVGVVAGVVVGPAAVGCGSRGAPPRPCPTCPGGPDGGAASSSPSPRGPGEPGSGAEDGGVSGARRPQHYSLASAAKAFRSHGACVAELSASLPPELSAEADPVNLAERICQTRRALAEKSVSLCEEIQDAHWPLACRRLLAGLYGLPEACPPLSPRARGREPACLALAARDLSLCRAVRGPGARRRCEAILGAAGGCRALRTSSDVEACERDRHRWRTVLRPAKPALDPKLVPELAVAVTAGGRTVTVKEAGVGRGVVVPQSLRAGAAVRFGRFPAPGRARPADRIRIVLEVDRHDEAVQIVLGKGFGAPAAPAAPMATRVPAPAPMGRVRPAPPPPARAPAVRPAAAKAATAAPPVRTLRSGARLCVLWKGKPVPLGSVSGVVALGPVPARRGAEVSGSFRATFVAGGETVQLSGRLRTFVRDVVPGAWLAGSCAEDLAERARAAAAAPGATPSGPGPGPEEGPPCYFVAHWEGLTQVGYRAYGLRPGGACARLGLREHDVVTAVGGKPARRWADVTALYRLLGGTGALTVTVRRSGRVQTLRRPPGGAR